MLIAIQLRQSYIRWPSFARLRIDGAESDAKIPLCRFCLHNQVEELTGIFINEKFANDTYNIHVTIT